MKTTQPRAGIALVKARRTCPGGESVRLEGESTDARKFQTPHQHFFIHAPVAKSINGKSQHRFRRNQAASTISFVIHASLTKGHHCHCVSPSRLPERVRRQYFALLCIQVQVRSTSHSVARTSEKRYFRAPATSPTLLSLFVEAVPPLSTRRNPSFT